MVAGADYLIVDDFIGQGATVANVAGFMHSNSGTAIGVTTVTGSFNRLGRGRDSQAHDELRQKHGKDLED
jgi:phosphoribosylpyrophosphate synthetase